MSHVNTKLRASVFAALLTMGFAGVSQASLVPGGSASSDAAGDYSAKLVGVGAGSSVSGTIQGESKTLGFAGVIKLALYDDEGKRISTAGTFCTDLQHPTGIGETYNASKEQMGCDLKYLVNNYPAAFSGISATEATARQAAVWHLADGFEPTAPITVVSRANEIVADVRANADCSSYEKPLILTVSADKVAAYEGETVNYTVSATRDGQPVAGKDVTLSTDFGALSTTSVTTDEFGEATFSVEASGAGTATVEANASYTMPAGVIFHALDLQRQKLLLADSQEGLTKANATTIWQVAQGSITVNIFHDRDTNGEDAGADNGEEDLAGWTVKLLDSDGNVVQTAETDENGLAFFNHVSNGEYAVTYDLKDTWFDTNGDTPVAEAGTSDAIVVDNDSHYEDMGVIQTPFVDVCVFFDNNNDGAISDGEALLNGWNVELFRENGSAVVGASGTTNDDGTVTLTFHRHSDYEKGGTEYFATLIEQDAWKVLQDAAGVTDDGVATTEIFTLTENMFEEVCFPVEEDDEQLPFEQCVDAENEVTWTVTVTDVDGNVVAEKTVENGGTVKILDSLEGQAGSVTIKGEGGENMDLTGWTVTLTDSEDSTKTVTVPLGAENQVTFDDLEAAKGIYDVTYTLEADNPNCGSGGLDVKDIAPSVIDLDNGSAVDGS